MDLGKQDLDMQFGNNIPPLVAVWMVTYNHEIFIEQAIESVMIQETNFEYKLFIGEDCSTDSTRGICEKLKEKYPNKIVLYFNDKNLGGNLNALQIYKQCFESGAKYIALLEGDDYWTDPLKLQKQVDFLEVNPDYGICFHKVEEINLFDKSKNRIFPNINNNTIYTIEDYVLNNLTATCSIVFNAKSFSLPNWFKDLPFGDLGLVLLVMNSFNKKGMVLNDIMGVYRIHSGGVHGKFQESSKTLIKAYNQHICFAKIIENKLLDNRIYGKFFLQKKITTYTLLSKLYKDLGMDSMAKYIDFKILTLKVRNKIY